MVIKKIIVHSDLKSIKWGLQPWKISKEAVDNSDVSVL